MWSLATRKHARRRVLAGASRVDSTVDQRYFSTHATPTETRAARPKPKRAVPRVRARSKRRPASPAHPETHTSELTQALESEGGGACPLQFGRDEVQPDVSPRDGQLWRVPLRAPKLRHSPEHKNHLSATHPFWRRAHDFVFDMLACARRCTRLAVPRSNAESRARRAHPQRERGEGTPPSSLFIGVLSVKISGQRFGELVGQTHCVSNLINWTY